MSKHHERHPARDHGFALWSLLSVEGARDSLKAAYLLGHSEAELEDWLYEERTAAIHPTLGTYSPDFVSQNIGHHAGQYMKTVLALDSAHASLLKLAADGAKTAERRRRQRVRRQVRAELRFGQ